MEINRCIKIAVLGAESTGKTVLCETLAHHYHTVWVPEYAREYFNDSDIYNYTIRDLEIIAQKQVQLEEAYLNKANRFLFCDTGLITLKIWAELEFNVCPDLIKVLMIKHQYDYFLITNNEVEWQQDEQRQNKFSRDLIFSLNEKEVQKTKKPYTIVKGLDEARVLSAIKCIEDLKNSLNKKA
jgi:NadR type nicotinamide-nucleotide adenylyltransferase